MAIKTVVVLLVGLVLASFADIQQPKKIPRLGRLSAGFPGGAARDEALKRGLRDFGYIEGKNIFIETRYAEGKRERYLTLATELGALRVGFFFGAGGGAG